MKLINAFLLLMAALVIAASDGLQTQWLLEPHVDIAESLRLLNLILEPTP